MPQPFFPSLEFLLEDASILEILMDGHNHIYVERRGDLVDVESPYQDESHLMTEIEAFAEYMGMPVDRLNPIRDYRLPDGSAVHIVIPPIAVGGPSLTIRKFPERLLTRDDLIQFGAWTETIANFLEFCVRGQLNIVIAGGTGSGKTTVMNVLAEMIPDHERIITVEHRQELRIRKPRLVMMETRAPNADGLGSVTMQDLIVSATRMRPDRILMGEAHGGEVLDLLQVVGNGYYGSMLNLHANGPRDALARLEGMASMHSVTLPLLAIREKIAEVFDLVVYAERLPDGRRRLMKITEVGELHGDSIALNDIFVYVQTGMVDGVIQGYFTATSLVPSFLKRLESRGIHVPFSLFEPKAM